MSPSMMGFRSRRSVLYPSLQQTLYAVRLMQAYSTEINGSVEQKDKVKPSLGKRIKDGLVHYWHGTKLLAVETRISSKLLWKMLHGGKLIRREQRQLQRTFSDLLRLVPFIVIMIVPFLEFALPVILKFFPNMLPSTFEDKSSAESKQRKQLKVKLETAKFLQDTLEQLQANSSPEALKRAQDFGEAFKKVRITGEPLTDQEVISLSKGLSDSITLEGLPRAQLVSICRYMGFKAFGTDTFLRFQITNRMKSIKADDELIDGEGVENLSYDELVQACQSRGIKYFGVTTRSRLESELKQWLQLHLRSEIPLVLLILSRALSLSEPTLGTEEALQNVIMSLPEHVVEEAKAAQDEFEDKLKIIKSEEDLIAKELAEQKKEGDMPMEHKDGDTAKSAETQAIHQVLSTLSLPEIVEQDKADLKELKEDLAELSSETPEGTKNTATELENEVEKLISDIDQELSRFEAYVTSKTQLLPVDAKGQISTEKLKAFIVGLKSDKFTNEHIEQFLAQIDKDGDGKVNLKDLIEAAKINGGNGTSPK